MLYIRVYKKWTTFDMGRRTRREEFVSTLSLPSQKQVASTIFKLDPKLMLLDQLVQLGGASLPTEDGLSRRAYAGASAQHVGDFHKYEIRKTNPISITKWRERVIKEAVAEDSIETILDPNDCSDCIFDIVKYALSISRDNEPTSNEVFSTAAKISKFINERKRGNKM